jgi:hypothetical protein
MKNEKPEVIRVCLNEDGTVLYFPWYREIEDYADKSLPAKEALNFLRAGVQVEFACDAPEDKHGHYETLNAMMVFTLV